ncbi:cardiolipin synthase, partial [bacterium]|nr:cardiolipin synthase [bacterium]
FLFWYYTTNIFNYNLGVHVLFQIFSILVVTYVVSTNTQPLYKLAWVTLIFLIPPTGGLIYILYTLLGQLAPRHPNKEVIKQALSKYLAKPDIPTQAQLPPSARQTIAYLHHFENFPVYRHTQTQYFPCGEDFFPQFLADLKAANHYIFLEYYIIEEGAVWDKVLDVLIKKAEQGIEVRVMYDDVGCLFSLPTNYHKKLRRYGIKTAVLNRFRPLLAFQMNNRDHRKIAIIDGKVGYTSGINLADEYMNLFPKHGYWKDTAIRLEGLAVNSLTMMYLQLWNSRHVNDLDFEHYQTHYLQTTDGYVQPFGDNPHEQNHPGKNVYLNLISKAEKSVWLTTPYLVPDNEFITALTNAAKSGVDARIIVPGICDHRYVHLLSQSFYLQLIEAGVQIYEFIPGFVHSKTLIVDNTQAVIGSYNLDFRSFYLQYEAGVYCYRSQAVKQLSTDLKNLLINCRSIHLEDVKEINFTTRVIRSLIRLVAPLI